MKETYVINHKVVNVMPRRDRTGARCAESMTGMGLGLCANILQCIDEISYLLFGCCASISTSSMTSVQEKKKGLDEVIKNY